MDNLSISDIVGILSAIVAIGTIVSGIVSGAVSSRVMKYRLEELEKKVDKHNNLIERTFKIEEHLSVLDEKVKVANHRIDDIEKEVI